MDRLTASLRVRLSGVVLVINAALVPLLYLGVAAIMEDGYAEQFVNPVRAYSRMVADELESVSPRDFDRRSAELLDSVTLSGQVVSAEIIGGRTVLHSSVSSGVPRPYRGDDFSFGDHGDQIYFISHPVKRPSGAVVLRLGFDESPTLERIAQAKRRVLAALLAFTLASLGVAIWLSEVIARPMVRLQAAAERVAGGDVHTELQMHSSIREVQELNLHLERMRQNLVGTSERLEREIREREVSESRRLDLERRMLHRERIATIGTLAGGVAHEFNNILTPILLYSQLALNETPPDSPRARDLSRIVAAAHRARSLITRILTFSREMDSQGVKVFSLRPTVEEALALLRAIVPTNIEIVLDSQVADMWVCGDPSLIHQVIINLGTNAYQAMRRTGGRLVMRLWEVRELLEGNAAPGNFALLEVSDTGHGIEPSAIAHIFEPFFTTREIGDGTGLGLSVVHGIVTSMGGSITVESAVDRGTTFRVYFPAAGSPVNDLVPTSGTG